MGGVNNVVAPQGTALTADHARILKRFTKLVVVCFDGDKAGWNATIRSLDSFLEVGLSMLIAVVPPPHDPDSYIKEQGGEAFRQLIKNGEPFFDFYLKRLCLTNDAATDRGRVAVVHDMREALQKTGSAVLLDTYAQKTAHRLGVDPESVRAEFKKKARVRSAPVEAEAWADEPAAEVAPPSEREFWFLRFLLLHDEQMDWVAQHLDLSWLQHPTVRSIVGTRLALHAEQSWRGLPTLLDATEDAAARALITRAVAEDPRKTDLARNIVEAVRLLRNDHLDRQLTACKLRLAHPEATPDEMGRILRQQHELRHAKQQPLMPPGEA